MANEGNQVAALRNAILERAQQLSEEHIHQGKMSREKILSNKREKIKLMEQKELLSARVNADRKYQRKVQASELHMQAEQDRNRWGLVQSVLDEVTQQINAIHMDNERYEKMFRALLKQSVAKMGDVPLVAYISSLDITRYADHWDKLVAECCGKKANIKLAKETCECSGGFKLMTQSGDVMLDNTFEGLFQRKDSELQRLIFERLFASVNGGGR